MIFGTDGIRGTVNKYPMVPDAILKFGIALGRILRKKTIQKYGDGHKPKVIIAKDTRLSGYVIESTLTAGLASAGINVTLVGPMPTPSVPVLIKSIRADLGIMITASHNPFHDNGIKIFDEMGHKLSSSMEHELQDIVNNQDNSEGLVDPSLLGKVSRLEDVRGRYIEYVKSCFPKNMTLEGMKIVVDCAHGAAYKVAPSVFWELGAEVITIGNEPNGLNINSGYGAMHPETLCKKVVETQSNIGIALDGDGDRLLICDEQGNVVHGDHLIATIAQSLHNRNRLRNNNVVITHLSNSSLEEYLNKLGLKVHRANVGDKNVAHEMRKIGSNFGGETSGHLILSDYTTTGDALIAALQVLTFMKEKNQPASDTLHLFELTPQKSLSVRMNASQNPLLNGVKSALIDKIKKANENMKIIVRKSGTENVIRIMTEGKDAGQVDAVLEQIRCILSTQ